MAFFNNCGCGCNTCRGPRGPMGPSGPPGPTGPAGPTLLASFLNASTAVIAPGGTIPLLDFVNFAPADIVHLAGSPSITLSNGYYLVNVSTVATSSTAGVVGIALNQDGTILARSATSETISGGGIASLSNEFVVIVSGTSSVINLVNNQATSTIYSPLNLNIQKINAPATVI